MTLEVSSAFLADVRKAALPGIWSQGVKLARDGNVQCQAIEPNDVTFRVPSPGSPVAATVSLFTEDLEWSCDCASKIDPCAHVVAAAIALDQGALPFAAQSGGQVKIVYDLSCPRGALVLTRALVSDEGKEAPLEGSLAQLVAQGHAPALPTHDDLTLDRWLSIWRRGEVPDRVLDDLFALLAGKDNVRFNGQFVTIAAEAVGLSAILRNYGEHDVELVLDLAGAPIEIPGRCVARRGNVIARLAHIDLAGDRFDRIPIVQRLSPRDFARFISDTLPSLEARMPVELQTNRLPRTGAASPPRLHFEVGLETEGLFIIATLVYGEPPIARVDGDDLVHISGDTSPRRDREAEHRLVHRLHDDLNMLPGRRVVVRGRDAAQMLTKLQNFGSEGEKLAALFQRQRLAPQIALHGTALGLSFTVEKGDGSENIVSGETVLQSWRDGLGVVPLHDGSWAPLPVDWLARYGDRIVDLLQARDEKGRVRPSAARELVSFAADLGLDVSLELAELRARFEQFDALPEVTLPDDLRADLREYQRLGVRWLSFLRANELGGILADDMGLGKTLQALTVFSGRTLVVCPRSVLFNWEAELRRFRPNLRTDLYHGPARQLKKRIDVTLTTYAVLRLDQEKLAKQMWDTIVLDEAQSIKNADSQAASAARSLKAPFRLALSGTPVENRLEELWSLMQFANPGLLGTLSNFRIRYSDAIASGDPTAQERLRAKIRPFMLRRTKREVVPELPPRTDSIAYVELDDAERRVYEAVQAATRQDVVARLNEGVSTLAILEALLRLRQAACHSALVPGQQAERSSKVEALIDRVTDAVADGHKVLIFSQWTSFLDRVEPSLTSEGISFLRLDGSTTDRAGVVGSFQDENGPPVLLLSLKAGGIGLNLTAADHVFLLDPWWNPAAEDQAADRAHRIGQDKPVFVYRMVTKDTVEERMLVLQERKRALTQAAVGDGALAQAITRDDLLALLEE